MGKWESGKVGIENDACVQVEIVGFKINDCSKKYVY